MKLTVVYASDANYLKLTAISVVSLLKHNSGARVVLLGCNLEGAARDLLRSCVEAHGGAFQYCDVSGEIAKLKEKGYCGYTSYAVYSRIFIPSLLPDDGRIVYLDGDTLINGPLNELLEIPLHGKSMGFAVDCVPCAYKKYVHVPKNQPYYNSGVMVLDTKTWRANRCTERFFEELEHPKGPLILPDQDVFARALPEEIALLPPKWNVISHCFLFSYWGFKLVVGGKRNILFTRDEYVEAQRDPRIFHFLGHTLGRPWYTSSRHPLRAAYRQAAAEAGFPEFAEQERPMTKDYKLQFWLHRVLPHPLFDLACNLLYRINIWLNYKV